MRLFIILGLLVASTYAAGGAGYVYEPNVVTSSQTLVSPVVGGFKSIADTLEIATLQKPATAGGLMGITKFTPRPVTANVASVTTKPAVVIAPKVTSVLPTKVSGSIAVTEAAIRRNAPGGVVSALKVQSRLGEASDLVNKVGETKKTVSSAVKEPTNFAFRGSFNDKVGQTTEVETRKTISSVIERPKCANFAGGIGNKVAETNEVAENQKTVDSVVKEPTSFASRGGFSDRSAERSEDVETKESITSAISRPKSVNFAGHVENKEAETREVSETKKTVSIVVKKPKSFTFSGGFNDKIVQTSLSFETMKPMDTGAQQFDRSESVVSEVSTTKEVVKSKAPFGRPGWTPKLDEGIAEPLPALNNVKLEAPNNDLSTTEKIISGVFEAATKVVDSKTVKPAVGLGTNGFAVNTAKVASATEAKETSVLVSPVGETQSENKIVSRPGKVPIVLKGSFKSEGVQVVESLTYATIRTPVISTTLRPLTNLRSSGKTTVPDISVRSSAFNLDKIVTAANLGAVGDLSQTENLATGNINEPSGKFYNQSPALIKSVVAFAPVYQSAAHSPVLFRSNTPTYSTVLSGFRKPVNATGLARKLVPLNTIGSTNTVNLLSDNKFEGTAGPASINTGTQIIASNVEPREGGFIRSNNAYVGASSNVIGSSINGLRTLPLAGISPKINLLPGNHVSYSSGIGSGIVPGHGLSSIPLAGFGISYDSATAAGLRFLPLSSTGAITASNVPIINSGANSYSSAVLGGSSYAAGFTAIDSAPATVEYNKQVFFFSAPEEVVNESEITYQIKNSLKKNLQVVLINAPENVAATNAALQLAKQAIEQKTSIYVLSKETNTAQIIGQLQQFQKDISTAPEVKLVKYRTPHELAHAKEEILSKYNNFGGPSSLIDGGVAPVLNYASANIQSALVPAVSKVLTGTVPIQQPVLISKGSRGSYLPPSHL